MSQRLEDRVLAAHPLAPAHRMVLLLVARGVPEGQHEALVNRAALARSLDAGAAVIGHALVAGEQLGLCRTLRNGRVAFHEDGLFEPEAPPVRDNGDRPAVRPAPPDDGEQVRLHTSVAQVLAEFGRQWQGTYRQRYIFTSGKDHKLAKALGDALAPEELARRVTNYLHHEDPYYTDCHHSFSVFAKDINKFGVGPRPPERSRIPDADATRRYLDSLRPKGER